MAASSSATSAILANLQWGPSWLGSFLPEQAQSSGLVWLLTPKPSDQGKGVRVGEAGQFQCSMLPASTHRCSRWLLTQMACWRPPLVMSRVSLSPGAELLILSDIITCQPHWPLLPRKAARISAAPHLAHFQSSWDELVLYGTGKGHAPHIYSSPQAASHISRGHSFLEILFLWKPAFHREYFYLQLPLATGIKSAFVLLVPAAARSPLKQVIYRWNCS